MERQTTRKPRTRAWFAVARRIGGIYDLGPLFAVVHRSGFWIAWRQVVRFDWKLDVVRDRQTHTATSGAGGNDG